MDRFPLESKGFYVEPFAGKFWYAVLGKLVDKTWKNTWHPVKCQDLVLVADENE